MYYFLKDFYPIFSCRKARYEEKDEILIVSSKKLELIFLNSTAREFVIHADGSKSLDQILTIMMGQYDVEKEVLATDLIFLVRDLQWKNLLSFRKRPVFVNTDKI